MGRRRRGGDLTDEATPLAGFVTAQADRCPAVFDRPDRTVVGDIYVREPYRGSGLAETLVSRVADHAREAGCTELALGVDADNDRALAFYERLSFAPHRLRLTRPVGEL
ncbi:GNAT family N-acetyltransferase [Halomarina litorea]|uniref:GNAT family N-acetyltransferase n=1 Tax=Halomarina litorea TaxID=2961595 RepID=UPI0020C1E514|nr:GNAT family N-acetyltransferase [Halomarina sp. BCD28]